MINGNLFSALIKKIFFYDSKGTNSRIVSNIDSLWPPFNHFQLWNFNLCLVLFSFIFIDFLHFFFEEVSLTNDNDIAILTKYMRKLKADFSVLDLITFHFHSIFQLRLGIKARINSFVCRQQHTMADDKNNRFTRQKKNTIHTQIKNNKRQQNNSWLQSSWMNDGGGWGMIKKKLGRKK